MRVLTAVVIVFVCAYGLAGRALGQEAEGTSEQEADKYWLTECVGPSRSPDGLTCTAAQSIRIAQTQQLLFQIRVIVPANRSSATMELQGPLNFFCIPGGFGLSIDGTDLAKVPVSNCNQRGCYGTIQLEPTMISALKRGQDLRISILTAPQKPQAVDTPLAGFTRAMTAIE